MQLVVAMLGLGAKAMATATVEAFCRKDEVVAGGGGSASNAIATANMLMHLDVVQVGVVRAMHPVAMDRTAAC